MRVLFDTNVLLDVLLNRQPWVVDAGALWQLNDAPLVISTPSSLLAGFSDTVDTDDVNP